VRAWLRQQQIEPVIPARKDQPRQEGFDKPTYRRNIVERVGVVQVVSGAGDALRQGGRQLRRPLGRRDSA
jgi:hypothetical protein